MRYQSFDRRSVLGGAAATLAGMAGLSAETADGARTAARRISFTPGQVWLDTAGKPIQAHAGSIIQAGDDFYWYGENKEFTTGDLKVWTYGVRCYRSRDLYNWTDLGLIIPPDLHDPRSPLFPKAFLDRPHIVHDRRTGKFVCWIKMLSDPYQTRAVLIADAITGPYRMLHRDIRPLGMSAGDFDLVVSPDDGKGYMYFERVHSEMICADLTEDYTGFTGYYSTHMPRPGPPSVREAPAHFTRGGRQYLITSGTTGYFPNPSEVAVAETFHGPFTTLGDLHPADRSRTSFNSQISSVFRHPGKKDLYIALADRWMGNMPNADLADGTLSARVGAAFAKRFGHPPVPLLPEESEAMARLGGLNVNTSQARYVWLPIDFASGTPRIVWTPEWRIEDFA